MIIAPSLFAADAGKLSQEIRDVESAGAKYLHIDIMDGHFVPNLSFGPHVVSDIRSQSRMVFDVHLMVSHPLILCESFIKAGADMITVHAEIEENIMDVHRLCVQNAVKFGVALCPKTPFEKIRGYINLLDILLIMGINPGLGGQKFIPETLTRIKDAVTIREESGARYLISVDGGVNEYTAADIAASGADVLVAGTAVFGKESRKNALDAIRSKIEC